MNLRICWMVILMTSKPQFGGEKVKLGDVCTLVLGQSPISSTCNACGQGLPFFQGNADFGRINPEATSWCTEPKKIAEPGDILLSVRAPIGAVNIALEKCCIGRGVAAIRPNSRIIQTDYLKHVLVSYRSQLETKGTGSTFKAIGKKVLSEFEIPICSLNGQSQIENQLNQILDCIENCKMEIEQLDQLVKSRFVEMFGDPCLADRSSLPKKPLRSFCELKIGPFGSLLHKEDYISGGFPVVNPSHIVDGRIKTDSNLTIDAAKYREMESYQLFKGDVVLGRRGEIGRCAVVDEEGLLCGTGSMILRPEPSLCRSDYLQRVISFPSFAAALEKEAVGVTMKNLNAKIIGSAVVSVPPLLLQQEFADFVAQVDKSGFA